MYVLGLDTTGGYCSAAIVDEAVVIARESQPMSRGHAEHLAPMVARLLRAAHITAKDLGKIAVCTGPGSFTGVRVALAFAKGLTLPHGIPVIGVSALQVWAASLDAENGKDILSCADVRRNEIFWQVWKNGKPQAAPVLSDVSGAPKANAIVGTGAHLLGGTEQDSYVSPEMIAWLGAEQTPETASANPLYHRPPDAKLPGGKTL